MRTPRPSQPSEDSSRRVPTNTGRSGAVLWIAAFWRIWSKRPGWPRWRSIPSIPTSPRSLMTRCGPPFATGDWAIGLKSSTTAPRQIWQPVPLERLATLQTLQGWAPMQK